MQHGLNRLSDEKDKMNQRKLIGQTKQQRSIKSEHQHDHIILYHVRYEATTSVEKEKSTKVFPPSISLNLWNVQNHNSYMKLRQSLENIADHAVANFIRVIHGWEFSVNTKFLTDL